MKINQSYKAQLFEESVIREMSRLANKYNAINLAQGFPDFPAPDFIKEYAIEAINNDINQYAITWGSKNLRYALANKYKSFYNIDYDPENNITVCCGSTECMISALLGVINEGDEVVIFEPFYENYGPDVILCGAKPVYITLKAPEFSFSEDDLKKVFSDKTKAIIINSPHNPTGKVFSKEELELIAKYCLKYDVIAITDEIYEHIIYSDTPHIPIASIEGMKDRTITISGISKTFSVTGWRIGYILAPENLTKGIRKVHDFLTVGAPAPLQEAAAKALMIETKFYRNLRIFYEIRKNLLLNALKNTGLNCIEPEGAYYILASFEDFNFDNDIEFTEYLIKEIGVAVVPGSSFYRKNSEYGKHLIRFCFCKTEETLQKAIGKLKKLSSKS
jgi:aspartate/methionine/tyrosine aminotransferase